MHLYCDCSLSYTRTLIDIFLHLDQHLKTMFDSIGIWMYVLLFLVVLCETGLVVTPFLPGDSLLFAVGSICGLGSLNIWIIIPLLMLAANLGDLLNYYVGNTLGERIVNSPRQRFFNRKALDRTHAFYEKHGGRTIVFARFVPLVRTFAPFVAGLGKMSFRRFISYSIGGGAAWVISFVCLGFYFGNQEVVRKNFMLVILAILVISIMPAVIEFIRHRRSVTTNS